MQLIRTNNHAEGWHCRVNTKGAAGMNFYDLIVLLYQEADLVPLTVDMLCANNLRVRISKSNADLQANVNNLWERYQPEDGEKTMRTSALCWLNLQKCTIFLI